MPFFLLPSPTDSDGDGNLKAVGIYAGQALDLYAKLSLMDCYPDNYIAAHHIGVTNVHVLLVLTGCGKACHQTARMTFPEGDGSVQDTWLSQYWHALNDLSIILKRDAPPVRTLTIQPPLDLQIFRQCLEQHGQQTEVLEANTGLKDLDIYSECTLNEHRSINEKIEQHEQQTELLEANTGLEDLDTYSECTLNEHSPIDEKKAMSAKPSDSTGSPTNIDPQSSKAGRHLRKYVTVAASFLKAAVIAVACFEVKVDIDDLEARYHRGEVGPKRV